MAGIFSFELVVPPDAIDALGHANNAVYLQWLEAAATAHSTAQGWSTSRYLDSGLAWVARSHHIEYRRPAREGDRLIVRTWVQSMERVSSIRAYRVERAAEAAGTPGARELLARAETRWVLIRLDTGRPVRIPPSIAECFEIVDYANDRVDTSPEPNDHA